MKQAVGSSAARWDLGMSWDGSSSGRRPCRTLCSSVAVSPPLRLESPRGSCGRAQAEPDERRRPPPGRRSYRAHPTGRVSSLRREGWHAAPARGSRGVRRTPAGRLAPPDRRRGPSPRRGAPTWRKALPKANRAARRAQDAAGLGTCICSLQIPKRRIKAISTNYPAYSFDLARGIV
eukprot:5834846-Prymnesium_polylepis.3